ncbi:MAG: hypothetical protein Q8P90_03725 [bacterium]|nr:hypothetical protein [bacterium]
MGEPKDIKPRGKIDRSKLPPQDRGRSDYELDPSYWDNLLKMQDASLLTHAEEELGIPYGAEGGEDVIPAELNEDDERIARVLDSEPGQKFHSSPVSVEEMLDSISMLVQDRNEEQLRGVKMGVHSSCVSGDLCCYVVLPQNGKERITFHFSTRNIDNFIPDNLAALVYKRFRIETEDK